ncbi:MAG: MarR family transcriptional regulator [Tissierellia bacterium]|jgi:DNA-binding MarR family transcriptional regulator|nr:MarR family transcriptional regulator [Bacillota bacterium]NLK57675.1 MarR family transcriptional regulator [Tissierellia bacterium]
MNALHIEEVMLANMDRIMRLLRRRPAGKQHLGRGAYRLLSTVAEKEGISTRDLAATLGVRPSSLNERLLRLEENAILLRERDPQDQRVFLVRLLPGGDALLEEVKAERNRMLAAIGTILTEEELDTMIHVTEKLADGLEALSDSKEDPSCP